MVPSCRGTVCSSLMLLSAFLWSMSFILWIHETKTWRPPTQWSFVWRCGSSTLTHACVWMYVCMGARVQPWGSFLGHSPSWFLRQSLPWCSSLYSFNVRLQMHADMLGFFTQGSGDQLWVLMTAWQAPVKRTISPDLRYPIFSGRKDATSLGLIFPSLFGLLDPMHQGKKGLGNSLKDWNNKPLPHRAENDFLGLEGFIAMLFFLPFFSLSSFLLMQ